MSADVQLWCGHCLSNIGYNIIRSHSNGKVGPDSGLIAGSGFGLTAEDGRRQNEVIARGPEVGGFENIRQCPLVVDTRV